MKRSFLYLYIMILLMLPVFRASAQEADNETPPVQQFGVLKVKNPFDLNGAAKYYRFPTDTLFYEPIDLTYFPHETWDKKDWALLGRWGNGRTYNQMIYSDTPAVKQMIHGTDVTEKYGFLKDFYLYADLYVLDNYPEETGSCYVYYSNSWMTGYWESKGIMIDPESGIYEVTNLYGGEKVKYYMPALIHHDLELIRELDPADYTFSAENIAETSIGAPLLPKDKFVETFPEDLEYVTSSWHAEASPSVKVYRVEVIRIDGVSDIYINGKQVASLEDGIVKETEDGEFVPDNVSWTFGPILNPEGLTVTCSVGDFYVFGPGK